VGRSSRRRDIGVDEALRMCGIVGGLSVEGGKWRDGRERLDRAVACLAHRGPDDRGVYVSADASGFLGHSRLSIIDLEGGRQPIVDETGGLRLCENGEIYNYRALREELIGRGHVFRTHSDGEVALHLYQEDAHVFAKRLDGMFAIALLDEPDGRLTLVRDRNGIKPLYYAFDDHRRTLLFASEIKAILAVLGRRAELSGEGLRQYLRWKYIPDPLTIYEDVFKLPPGHVLTATRRGRDEALEVQIRPFWRLEYAEEKLADEGEALALLDEKLRAAVKSHLESDVEVGALLSGGVDSSLVVALTSIVSGRRVKTFTVGFEETGFDQCPFARKLAEKYGTEHYEEQARLDPMEAVAALARQFDEPFADSSALASYRVCQVASRHVKVVLTGDGGDETFAGYGRYEELLEGVRGERPRTGPVGRAAKAVCRGLFSEEAKFLKRSRTEAMTPLERHEEHQVMCSPAMVRRLLCERFAEAEGDRDLFEQYRHEGAGRCHGPLDVSQYVDLRMYLPGDILTKVDRTSMACSLECRVPLLDHSITEFSGTLAADLKVRGGVRKYLLKKLAERYVPRELLYRPKMGFRVPIRRWFKRDLLERTEKLLLEGKLAAGGVLSPAGLRWVFRMQRRPWIDFGTHLWAMLFLESWARECLA
jgi:asparagine synthase (glutamine-hydrolysing)